MSEIVAFILNDNGALDATSLVAFMAFTIVIYGIASIARSALSIGGGSVK